jgi:hypothetical protein
MNSPAWESQVKQYRKKPVVIEAMRYTGENADDVIAWGFQAGIRRLFDTDDELVVPTLEGEHIIRPGLYVIKGVEGEFYGCDPDIFHKTYEEATP